MNTSIYIKEPLLSSVKKRAKRRKISLSKYVERCLEASLEESPPTLSAKRLSVLNGCCDLGGDALADTENVHE